MTQIRDLSKRMAEVADMAESMAEVADMADEWRKDGGYEQEIVLLTS